MTRDEAQEIIFDYMLPRLAQHIVDRIPEWEKDGKYPLYSPEMWTRKQLMVMNIQNAPVCHITPRIGDIWYAGIILKQHQPGSYTGPVFIAKVEETLEVPLASEVYDTLMHGRRTASVITLNKRLRTRLIDELPEMLSFMRL